MQTVRKGNRTPAFLETFVFCVGFPLSSKKEGKKKFLDWKLRLADEHVRLGPSLTQIADIQDEFTTINSHNVQVLLRGESTSDMLVIFISRRTNGLLSDWVVFFYDCFNLWVIRTWTYSNFHRSTCSRKYMYWHYCRSDFFQIVLILIWFLSASLSVVCFYTTLNAEVYCLCLCCWNYKIQFSY